MSQPAPVQELLRREDFEQYDAPVRAAAYRAAFLLGLVAWSALQFAMTWSGANARRPTAIAAAAAVSLLGGALFGLAMVGAAYLDHRRQLAQLERVLAYDPRIVPPPPANATHRLPCGLVIDRRTVVPGSLYVLPNGLLFRSNVLRRSLAGTFSRGRASPLELLFAPAREVTLDARLLRRSRLQRVLSRLETPLLLVQIHETVAAFRVAATLDTLRRLDSVMDDCRHGPLAG